MQEQSGGSALKQTSADQWDFGRFDHAANCGSIVAGSTTRRSTDHQQQQNEKGTKGSENVGNHRVSVSGLLASLLPLVNFSFFPRPIVENCSVLLSRSFIYPENCDIFASLHALRSSYVTARTFLPKTCYDETPDIRIPSNNTFSNFSILFKRQKP